MDAEIASSKQFFNLHHITLSDEWLESCIEWFREEYPNLNYSPETLHQKVFEQWLLLDLRVTEVAILPPNLNQKQKMVLNGVYSLQMMYIMDISMPKHLQLQKIRNTVHNTTDEEYHTNVSSKRMLQLVLTDGVQEVDAIEYKPIPLLNLNLTPGVKMKITGPVTIRRGQLMLESKNVAILGGEVEELLVSNAVENILAKELNLPLNPQPNLKFEVKTEVASTNPSQISNSTSNNNANTKNQYIVLNNPSATNNEKVRNTPFQSSITSYATNTKAGTSSFKEDIKESILNKRDNVKAFEPCSVINVKPFNENEEQMIISECDELLELEKDFEMEERKKQELKNSTTHYTPNPLNRFSNESDIDVFDGIDIDEHLDLIDRQISKNCKITPITELVLNNITNGKFVIKAKFKSVSSKLTINNVQQWSLRIIVEDCTGEIELWVHSDVITEIINCTPTVVLGLKEDIRNKNPDASNLMMQKINDLRSKIEALDGEMEITFKSSEQYPTITHLK